MLRKCLKELLDLYKYIWNEDHDRPVLWRIAITPVFLLLFFLRWLLILADRLYSLIDDDHRDIGGGSAGACV